MFTGRVSLGDLAGFPSTSTLGRTSNVWEPESRDNRWVLFLTVLIPVKESDDRYRRGLRFPDNHHNFIYGAVFHASVQSASILLDRAQFAFVMSGVSA